MNTIDKSIAQRQARFTKLLNRRRELHPNENYQDAFTAVASEEGQQLVAEMRLNKQEWKKLKRAFLFGHSLGAIAQATGVSRGTLSVYAARHRWSRDRIAGTEILRKENETK